MGAMSNITAVSISGCEDQSAHQMASSQHIKYEIAVADGLAVKALSKSLIDTPSTFIGSMSEQLQSLTGVMVDKIEFGKTEIIWESHGARRALLKFMCSCFSIVVMLVWHQCV